MKRPDYSGRFFIFIPMAQMAQNTFLDKLSEKIVSSYPDKLQDIVIILPNKRAKVFLLEALKRQLSKTVFAPQIISIEDFVQDVAGIRSIDAIELLFEFYNVYLSITDKEKQQPFENFADWGKTLLQDFNEIDRYLLNHTEILNYLKDIEEINHWAVDVDKRTQMISNYLEFWNLLPLYYTSLYDHLLKKGGWLSGPYI